MVRETATESLGMPMIFTLCDLLREEISELNDAVMDKFDSITEAKAKAEKKAALPQLFTTKPEHFTPVNKETFGKWCVDYMARLKKEREITEKAWENKPTGKAIFEAMNKASFEELTLDDDEPILEEEKDEDEEEGEDF